MDIDKIRATAQKAVKLAICLLGDEAPECIIEEQARLFLPMGEDALYTSLVLFHAIKGQEDEAERRFEES